MLHVKQVLVNMPGADEEWDWQQDAKEAEVAFDGEHYQKISTLRYLVLDARLF